MCKLVVLKNDSLIWPQNSENSERKHCWTKKILNYNFRLWKHKIVAITNYTLIGGWKEYFLLCSIEFFFPITILHTHTHTCTTYHVKTIIILIFKSNKHWICYERLVHLCVLNQLIIKWTCLKLVKNLCSIFVSVGAYNIYNIQLNSKI